MTKRILVKISGEALSTDIHHLPNYDELEYLNSHLFLDKISGFGLTTNSMLLKIALDLKTAQQNDVEIVLVVGGGNICRGSQGTVPAKYRTEADKIGMLATIINGLILNIALNTIGAQSVVLSTRSMPAICELYTPGRALQYLESKKVVICVGGSGQPFFSTDTAAVIRAGELGCDVLFKATKVQGIYSADPKKDPNAQFLPVITYDDFLTKNIKIMDFTAISVARDQNLRIEIFDIYQDQAITKAIAGDLKKSVIMNNYSE